MNRRAFLETLGLAASAAIAFPKVASGSTWLFPTDIIPHVELVTPEWIAAEALSILCEQLPAATFIQRRPVITGSQTFQLGADLTLPDNLAKANLEEIRKQFLEPCMSSLASEIKYRKPRYCIPLELPQSLDIAVRAVNPEKGLNLRFVRTWQGGNAQYDDEYGNSVSFLEPGFINRFDICIN